MASGCLSSPDPKPLPDDWLRVEDGRIRHADGSPFHGRGAAIPDTRGCNACTFNPPVPEEVERRIDELVDVWGASFIRLMMESYAEPAGRVHYQNALDDAEYLADLERLVAHIGSKPGVYVALTLWDDPTLTSAGWPTEQTRQLWALLAERFADDAHVLFSIAVAPQTSADGTQDAALWQELDDTVAAIRAAEQAAGAPPHVVIVPGTQGGTRLDYYVDHPITAAGGGQIAYGVSVGDPPPAFQDIFLGPAASLPVVVGMFGPVGAMTEADASAMMLAAEDADIPWLAIMFHMRCPPNLLVDNSGNTCGVDMALEPTPWGERLIEGLARTW